MKSFFLYMAIGMFVSFPMFSKAGTAYETVVSSLLVGVLCGFVGGGLSWWRRRFVAQDLRHRRQLQEEMNRVEDSLRAAVERTQRAPRTPRTPRPPKEPKAKAPKKTKAKKEEPVKVSKASLLFGDEDE